MQMYKVTFRQHLPDTVDTGDVLVCAANNEAASDLVMMHLGLTPSKTVVEAVRIKPSVYELSRRELVRSDIAVLPSFVTGRARDELIQCEVSVTAVVAAYSEQNAVRRLANALIEDAAVRGRQMPKHISELAVTVDRKDCRPTASRVEEQAIYKERRIFQGGAARPR